VDAVRGPGDDEEDEHEVEDRAEVDAAAADADVEARFEPDRVARHPPEEEREDQLAEQLVAAREPERAPFDDLDVVVGEAQGSASQRDAETASADASRSESTRNGTQI